MVVANKDIDRVIHRLHEVREAVDNPHYLTRIDYNIAVLTAAKKAYEDKLHKLHNETTTHPIAYMGTMKFVKPLSEEAKDLFIVK